MSSNQEENKTEEATPFKLKRARKKGTVARGTDLGYFSILVGFSLFLIILMGHFSDQLVSQTTRYLRIATINAANKEIDSAFSVQLIKSSFQFIPVIGAIVIVVVIAFEIVQLRGIVVSTHPLKPDFKRINPAQGIKRFFSMRTLRDALKNIIKFVVYLTAAVFFILFAIKSNAPKIIDAASLGNALTNSSKTLVFIFVLLAAIVAMIDQVIARTDFKKQMRMSRHELKKEHKEREGDPKVKQKRKKLHTEFSKQTKALGDLPGSDLVIVNPQHFAVALTYRPEHHSAPQVTTKGRNKFALLLKERAFRLGIPVIEDPPLARALFKSTDPGGPIPQDTFKDVAAIYIKRQDLRTKIQRKAS